MSRIDLSGNSVLPQALGFKTELDSNSNSMNFRNLRIWVGISFAYVFSQILRVYHRDCK